MVGIIDVKIDSKIDKRLDSRIDLPDGSKRESYQSWTWKGK